MKLPFVCPLCGGRLIKTVFMSATDDYYISKTGKSHKKPFRKASKHLSNDNSECAICCINYPDDCDFATNFELTFDSTDLNNKYLIYEEKDGTFSLYEN